MEQYVQNPTLSCFYLFLRNIEFLLYIIPFIGFRDFYGYSIYFEKVPWFLSNGITTLNDEWLTI